MRKVRDYDAELKTLNEKARALKAKKVEQLGMLVVATGADAFETNIIAGILLDALTIEDTDAKEAWRAKGAAFFQQRGRKGSGAAGNDRSSAGADATGNAAH